MPEAATTRDMEVDMGDVIKLISDIQHGKVCSSYDLAQRSETLVENVISTARWESARDLMRLLSIKCRRLMAALPQESVPGNIVRHALKIIREEYVAEIKSSKADGGEQSLHHLITAGSDSNVDYSRALPALRAALLDHLAEYKVELETGIDNIANQAFEHIHSNEIIMTLGHSNTVERFLRSAAKTRKFQVMVVEAAPACHGHEVSMALGRANIQTTVIPDSGMFAMMARINKVIVGTHTVLASGGLRAPCGTHALALAAKHYSVPVMVLAPMYKLSPVHLCSYEQDAFNVCVSPGTVLPLAAASASASAGALASRVHVCSPAFDYVPPELVTLFISHHGGNAPSYVYRLLTELYHPDDYEL